TDKTGTVGLGNSNQGVHIADASANTIGGTAPGAGNVISGNTFSEDSIGLQIVGGGASGNVVLGNRIGTDVTGTKVINNNYDGAANRISGNVRDGVEFSYGAVGNVVLGNLFGTDPASAAPRDTAGGVVIDGGTANTIGGTAPGAGNVISGNGAGIAISGSGT